VSDRMQGMPIHRVWDAELRTFVDVRDEPKGHPMTDAPRRTRLEWRHKETGAVTNATIQPARRVRATWRADVEYIALRYAPREPERGERSTR